MTESTKLKFAQVGRTGSFENFRGRDSHAETLNFRGQVGYASRAFTQKPFENDLLDNIASIMASYPIIGDTLLYVAKSKPLILVKDNPEARNGSIQLNPASWNEEANIKVEGYDGLVRRSADGSVRALDTQTIESVLSTQDIGSNPLVYLLLKDQLGFDNLERMINRVNGKKANLVLPSGSGIYVPGVKGRDSTSLTIYCNIAPDTKDELAFSLARWLPSEGTQGFIGPLTAEKSGYHLTQALKK